VLVIYSLLLIIGEEAQTGWRRYKWSFTMRLHSCLFSWRDTSIKRDMVWTCSKIWHITQINSCIM